MYQLIYKNPLGSIGQSIHCHQVPSHTTSLPENKNRKLLNSSDPITSFRYNCIIQFVVELVISNSLCYLMQSTNIHKCPIQQQAHSGRTNPLNSNRSHLEEMEHPEPAAIIKTFTPSAQSCLDISITPTQCSNQFVKRMTAFLHNV